jgi:hypothetical protein
MWGILMKPDGMLVEPEHVVVAFQDVTERGSDQNGSTDPTSAQNACTNSATQT